jgi:hypothetical protein
MSIQCEKCGDIRGFFVREPIQYNRCKLCDRKTELTNMAPAVLKCYCCGSSAVINTNMKESVITITCPFCRAPVDFELDRAGTTYRAMEESC